MPGIKVITVVGARPNFMKAAPIIAAIRKRNDEAKRLHEELDGAGSAPAIDHVLVHTGQHYDAVMSNSFFSDLNLPAPDIHLGVGQGSAAVQTAEILTKFEKVLSAERPDAVLVVGDVNSTLACAVATAKTSFDSMGSRPLLAHVEAGLRSFDRSMPEEMNRVVTDHLSDLFFVTEESGVRNLMSEGLSADAIHFVGNTMIDSLLAHKDKADSSTVLERLGLRRPSGADIQPGPLSSYALLTLHRPANVDNRDAFLEILAGLEPLIEDRLVVFPVHPRTRQRINEFGVDPSKPAHVDGSAGKRKGLVLTDPLGYLDFLCLMKHATLVVTDSGGIQEETTCLGIPCVTVRNNTERPVTLERGTNVLAGTARNGIQNAIRSQTQREALRSAPENWDGRAAQRIVDILASKFAHKLSGPAAALAH
jgi:UDP-N-acetylglucosamine 2-epimerase (non-hydrolysing)